MTKLFNTLYYFKWFTVTYKTIEGVIIVLSVVSDGLPLNFDEIESNAQYKELYDHIIAAANNNASGEAETLSVSSEYRKTMQL